MADEPQEKLLIASEIDVVVARQRARMLALSAGFSAIDATLIATAVSEIARNISTHVGEGEIRICIAKQPEALGIRVIALDEGPGIVDVQRALEEGFSSTQGFGLGLPSARKLMDEFWIESRVGMGTTVTMEKWMRRARTPGHGSSPSAAEGKARA